MGKGLEPSSPAHQGLVVPPVDEQRHAQVPGQRVQHAVPQAAVKQQEVVPPGVRQQAPPRRPLRLRRAAVLLVHHHCGACARRSRCCHDSRKAMLAPTLVHDMHRIALSQLLSYAAHQTMIRGVPSQICISRWAPTQVIMSLPGRD